MTDWVVAGRKWMRGSGEEDKRWEVTKTRVVFGSRSIAFANPNSAWSKPLFALLAQSPIMIGSLSLLAASSPESLWKGWRYGECTKWKRLESQMGSQSSDGNGDQGSDFEF